MADVRPLHAQGPETKGPEGATGVVVFADGRTVWGEGFGAEGQAVGELCFNTAMTGYQEVMTDPSYARQVIAFTFPHIGNVGANDEDVEAAEARLGAYRIKALDIVLLRTDAAKRRLEKAYLTEHPGMTKESVHYLLDRGVKVMGIDAIGFDPPVAKMFERKKFWEAHRVMREREYYHLENMCNLDQIPAPYHSFTVSVLPVKWRGASAAPVRAVAIVK